MSKTAIPRPPGPKGRWAVGNSYDYDKDRIGFLRRCLTEYGDVFSFSPTTVFIGDPELVHELLNESNTAFMAESPLFANAEDSARLERNIDDWMATRRQAWAGITRVVAKMHGERILTSFDRTLKDTGGHEFDVMATMRRFSAGMVGDFVFGPGSEDVVDAADLRSALAIKFMASNLTIPKWLPLPSVRRALKAEDAVVDSITAHLAERRAHPHAEPEDMLDLLLADSDPPLSDEGIVAVLGASMLASFGSPGSALCWVFLELARDSERRNRLREEALRAIDKTGSVLDDSQLPYAKIFVREILRMYPPTWLMGRVVRRPYTLGGWRLTPGETVMFSPYLLQRDPRWWTDPDTFDPERWERSASPESRRAYLPFGSGPRICLGLHLGLFQLVTAVAHLSAHYRIEASTADNTAVPDAILLPRALKARVVPIDEQISTVPPEVAS